MTRNDYELIARALNKARPEDTAPRTAVAYYDRGCREVADMLAGTNARFDRARFLAACGVKA